MSLLPGWTGRSTEWRRSPPAQRSTTIDWPLSRTSRSRSLGTPGFFATTNDGTEDTLRLTAGGTTDEFDNQTGSAFVMTPRHINGFTAWAYWLGWFPVAPLNMILASFYLADRFGINTSAGFTPIHTFIAWSTLIISVIGILLFFIPAYRGIRFGATFATVWRPVGHFAVNFKDGCAREQGERP